MSSWGRPGVKLSFGRLSTGGTYFACQTVQSKVSETRILHLSSGKRLPASFRVDGLCAEVQPWLYEYDAHKDADSALASLDLLGDLSQHVRWAYPFDTDQLLEDTFTSSCDI
jgi:hypothetical protein